MKKFVIYTILILTLFFSVNTGAFLRGDLSHTLGGEDVLAQEEESGFAATLAKYIGAAVSNTIGKTASTILSSMEAGAWRVLDVIVSFLGTAIIWAFSWILFVSGTFLNQVIDLTVVKMGTLIEEMDGIDAGWILFRDISNIFFIFIILYVAIATILELGVDTRKTLVRLIVAALLINFSLFFTKIIIDASNLLTVNLYSQVRTFTNESESTVITNFINDLDGGLSGAFMQQLKIQTFYPVEGTGAITDVMASGPIFLVRVWTGSMLMLVAAIIFFAAAIMFLLRFVIFIFLMITAPIAYIAIILPKTEHISKKWWSILTDQAIFAPVFMLMTVITLNIMGSFNQAVTKIGGEPSLSNDFFNPKVAGTAMMVPLIGLVVSFAFLVGILIISKKAGGVGSDWATKVGGRAVFGGVGWVGRNTVGRAGARLADRAREAAGDENRSAATRWAARLALRGGEATSKASFDARNVAGSAASSVSSPLGGGKVDFSKIKKEQKGGFTKQRENAEKKRQEEAELLNPSKVEIIRAEQELAEAKDNPEALRKHREEKLAEIDNQILAYNKTIASTKDDFVKGNLGKRVTELTQQRAKYDVSDEEVIKSLQSKVDILKGVDEKEAKKRAEKEVEKISVAGFRNKSDEETTAEYEQHREMFYSSKYGTKTKEEAEKKHYQEKYNAETLEEARKKQATKIQKEHPGVGKKRKEQFAKDIQNRSFLMRLLTLKTRAQLDREADAIRKGKKKTVEEIRDDLNKATGKTVSEDESEPSDGTKDPSKSEKS